MIDISFVQNNLPTPEEQLELLTHSLRNRNEGFLFDLVSEADRTKRRIYKIGGEIKLNTDKDTYPNFYPTFESKKSYLTFKVNSIIKQLIISMAIHSREKQYQDETMSILKPEALLEKTYISFVERDEEIYLVGIIGIYFE